MPLTPTMTVRYGLTERLQLGMQAGLSYGRAEATFQVLETPIVDLALGADLGLGASPVQVEHDVERKSNLYPSLGVPVLGGLRPLPALSVVGHLGPPYWGGIWSVQAGAGLDVAVGSLLSLRPHVSVLLPPADEEEYRAIGNQARPLLVGFDLAF